MIQSWSSSSSNSNNNNNEDNSSVAAVTAETNVSDILPMHHDYSPIALLVPLGGSRSDDCDALTKIQVALQIQQNMIFGGLLYSVIFYNVHGDDDDLYDPNGDNYYNHNNKYQQANVIYPMGVSPQWDPDLIPGIDSLILSTVSFATGSMILRQMEKAEEENESYYNIFNESTSDTTTTTSQYLLNRGNLEWKFLVSLDRGANAPFRNNNYGSWSQDADGEDDDDHWGTYAFIWVRFMLFAFIFCFPFMRFLRMWWMAGGRIRFRRNEAGRIVGLMYQAPMQNWFAPHANQNQDSTAAPIRDKLTNDQVMELPEISYEVPSEETANDSEETEPPTVKSSEETLKEGDDDNDDSPKNPVQVKMGNDDTLDDTLEEARNGESSSDALSGIEQANPGGSCEETTLVSSDSTSRDEGDISQSQGLSSGVAEECNSSASSPDSSTRKALYTTTISTTCSICIDEFEQGEKIRLLPRCGHGYHTECILPWLTERQGCCPLCKTSVLEKDVDNQQRDVNESQQEQGDVTGEEET